MERRGPPYRRHGPAPYLPLRMKIYTKTGDTGETSLLGGGRVPKHDLRVSAYGNVDELNAAIGVVLANPPAEFATDLLTGIQRDLLRIGGRLAAPDPEKVARALEKTALDPSRVGELEAAIDRAALQLDPLQAFVLPGGTAKAAALHVARTVCRRAERAVARLAEGHEVPPLIPTYLNRLSDLLFTLARLANHDAGVPDHEW